MKIKKDVEVEGKQTFCATIDAKVGLELMGSGRSMNYAETEMKNTSMWDFFLQMLEFSKTKDETADKFRKCVLIIFPKLPYKLLKENYTSDEARDTLKKFMNILGWRNGGFSYKDKSHKPPGWPDALSYDDFIGPNSASIEEAMIILRSILLHHQYNPDAHVEVDADNNNGEGEKKKRKRKSKKAKSRALIDPEVDDGNGQEEQVQGAGDIPAERAESQELELEDDNGNHLEGRQNVEVTGADNTGLHTSDTEAADNMDQEDSLSESIADAISSAANVDSSEEGEDIMTGQQNKRKAQDQDDADDSHDEVAYDDADEHSANDDNSHSVQSEYENVRAKNVEERQKMMNLLGLNNLFAEKPTAANKKKRAKKSPPAEPSEPAEPRKSARLAQKDHTSNI